METKGTKIVIDSKQPYIRDFNGQFATATDVAGVVTERQSFSLERGGSIFLDKSDYRKQ